MRRGLTLLLMMTAVFAFAVDVDEEELQELGTADVDFINYEGPHDRIDTADEIRAIGRALGANVGTVYEQFEYAGKYRVIHAVDPAAADGLDADIFIPLATARVDHIDNMRRIISAFLEAAYDYSRGDADLLARFITVYNAVTRGNMDFYNDRYKEIVTQHLSAATAGMSRRYDEWPGKSRVVIPLSDGAERGTLGAIDTTQLADERVIEELRTEEDMAVDDRRDLVDLMERVVDEQEAAIDEEEAMIAEEQRRIAEEQQRLADERAALEDQQLTDAERQQREDELAAEQDQLDQDRDTMDQARDDLQDARQDVADLTETLREERERIARDTRSLLDEREIADAIRGLDEDVSPVYFIQVRDLGSIVLGQLVQINPTNGVLVNRSSENAIVSRSYQFIGGQLLVIAAEDDIGRLALFDTTTLGETQRGSDDVFLGSTLQVFGDPDAAYAVVRDQGDWYVGRFDESLQLIERSAIAVNPYTTLAFGDNKVWVQTSDDRIVALSLEDLRIAP